MKLLPHVIASMVCLFTSSVFAQAPLTLDQKKEKIKTDLAELQQLRAESARLDDKIRQSRLESQCYKIYNSIAKSAKFYVEMASAESSVAGSAAQILNSLTKEQALFGDRMQASISQILNLPTDAKSLGASIETANSLFSVHHEQEAAMISAEQAVLNQLSQAASYLNGVKSNLLRSKLESCEQLNTEVQQLNNSVTQWAQVLGTAYQRVADASIKRMRLREDLGSTLRAWLLKKGSVTTATALNDLVTKIDDTSKGIRFIEKVSDWWFVASGGRGPARGKMNTYQLYEGALRTLRADLAYATELESEANAMGTNPIVTQEALNFVAGYKQRLTEFIAETIKTGWETKYKNQLAFIDSYQASENLFQPLCGLNIRKQRNALNKVTTANEFAFAELGFVAVVDTCRK
jgi:hypothetical protein